MSKDWVAIPAGMHIRGKHRSEYAEVLTGGALEFVLQLERTYREQRAQCLQQRVKRQIEIDAGQLYDFLPETEHIRNAEWTVASLPSDLIDRRVEITGPAGDRKMVINALNSGAKCFMADLEDANSPTWENTMGGQINLRDAIARTISFTNEKGKRYTLNEEVATLIVRPRGWHLEEGHVFIDDMPCSASIFDFALYMYHNAKALLAAGSGPYFYLPKLESHLEARLWNDIFNDAEAFLDIPRGTIKATVLIETLPAAFEADEILYELREHSAGLNCGRWDYIFSYIKKLRNHEHFLLPDRAQVTMTVPFMHAYTSYVIQTCHKRGVHAMGGMAAQIPVKNDVHANEQAMNKVRVDKEREAREAHDGTWVAHPALVKVAMDVFDLWMPGANQIENKRADVHVTAADLLQPLTGTITEAGLRTNIHVGIQYIEAWLRGFGAVPIFNLMEDAATAEISRTQVWQWIRHPKGILEDGRKVTFALVDQYIEEELANIRQSIGDVQYAQGKYHEATELFRQLINQEAFTEFLTVPGMKLLS